MVYLARPGRLSSDSVPLGGASAYDGHGVDLSGDNVIVRLPSGVGEFLLLPLDVGNRWLLEGDPGVLYGLQISEDLREWATVHEDRAEADGRVVFEDSSPVVGQRFYRAVRLE